MFIFNMKIMKNPILILLLISTLGPGISSAQESKGAFSVGADIVSNYIWRGSKFGKGPAVQPTVEFTAGSFTLGAWGSYCFSDDEAPEADLYTSFGLGPVTLGMSSYYFPGTAFFKTENHAFEINGGLEKGIFSLSANWIVNKGAGSSGNDLYFEAGILAGKVNLFAGAGNGWHTPDGKFNFCNIGVTSVKEITISENLTIPLSGSVILNPASEQFHIVVGISL